ncbi:MAG TPA: hypothetical protein VF708_17235 [Pyrinomonadaceae bacterium]|jgi:hypothetical protein
MSDPQKPPACPACGAVARRANARFCSTCGRSLEGNYLPADALRASYHLHRRASAGGRIKGANLKRPMSSLFPAQNRNGASQAALAFATYALVPYLGILFCPGALLLGGVGLFNSFHAPQKGGRRTAYWSIFLGFLILCVQVLLWWVLCKVPEWTRGF